MKPERALELVARYAELTKQIKNLTIELGASLERCRGVDGKRDGFANAAQTHLDNRNRDMRTHLWGWYRPIRSECGEMEWQHPTLGSHGMVCYHCYNTHLVIQQRKQARKELGIVKGVMSRSIA